MKKGKGSKPKDQHYVPACYLREFVDPFVPERHNPYVWIFDRDGKNRRNKAPENILKVNELYTLQISGQENDYIVEESLQKLETQYATIFRNRIKKKQPLDKEEHILLSTFSYAMLHRTLKFKDNMERFLDNLVTHVEDMEAIHGNTSQKTSTEMKEFRKNAHSLSLVRMLPKMGAFLAQMSVAFLCTPKVGARFITSDNPCFVFNSDVHWQKLLGPGISQENAQILMPLSPEITLCLSWSNLKGYINISNSRVHEINRMVRAHSYNHFVSQVSKTNLIWFSPLPLDLFFLGKFVRIKLQNLLADHFRVD